MKKKLSLLVSSQAFLVGARQLLKDKKKLEVSELQAGLDDADVLIIHKPRTFQPSLKALLAKLREYKSDLIKLKLELKKLTLRDCNQPNQPAHEELLESGMAGLHKASSNQRERSAMSTERLNQSTDRMIRDSKSCT